VANPTHDPKKLHEYRERAASLYDLSQGVEERIGQAAELGSLQAARDALGGLTLKTKEFEEFRKTLTPAEIFLAKYNVEVINEHTVSFVIPKGVSRIEMLKEAHALVTDRNLVARAQLQDWVSDPRYTQEAVTSERIGIDGRVPNSTGKTREQQEAMVGKDNLPALEDLAVAFAVHWIATGEPLFGWYGYSKYSSYVVRGADGHLRFDRDGLAVRGILGNGERVGSADGAVSSRLFPRR
jgi:hypothetical protein